MSLEMNNDVDSDLASLQVCIHFQATQQHDTSGQNYQIFHNGFSNLKKCSKISQLSFKKSWKQNLKKESSPFSSTSQIYFAVHLR